MAGTDSITILPELNITTPPTMGMKDAEILLKSLRQKRIRYDSVVLDMHQTDSSDASLAALILLLSDDAASNHCVKLKNCRPCIKSLLQLTNVSSFVQFESNLP